MLRFGLDKSLDAIAGSGSLGDTVFQLIQHAIAHGFVPALFDAALAANPANPALLAIAGKRRAWWSACLSSSFALPTHRATGLCPLARGVPDRGAD